MPYDEWVPLVMGQDAVPWGVQTKKEVRRDKAGPGASRRCWRVGRRWWSEGGECGGGRGC